MKDNELMVWVKGRSSRLYTWKEKVKYAFELSMPGNGLDCHRSWEALIMGMILITVHSQIDKLFENLPVVFINSFDEINEENLKKWVL